MQKAREQNERNFERITQIIFTRLTSPDLSNEDLEILTRCCCHIQSVVGRVDLSEMIQKMASVCNVTESDSDSDYTVSFNTDEDDDDK